MKRDTTKKKTCPLRWANINFIDPTCIGERCQLWHFCNGEALGDITAAIGRLTVATTKVMLHKEHVARIEGHR